jgi:chemotaxis response regulator CheB
MKDAPVVLIGDDDWEALNKLTGLLGEQFYILMARNAGELTRFAQKFQPDVILVGESLPFGHNGAEKLLPHLIRRFTAEIIVLSENGTDDSRNRWKALGARDCLPHPTRYVRRARTLERRILEIAYPQSDSKRRDRDSE